MHPIKKFNIYFVGIVAAGLMFLTGCATTLSIPSADIIGQVERASDLPVHQALPEHERLVYRIKWMGLTAGELVAEIKGKVQWKGRLCYVIEVTGRSSAFISKFYRVEDRYRSYFDAEKLYPLRYEEYRNEGSYRKDAVTEFDHEAGKAYFKNATDGTEKVYDIPAGVQDSLTASYLGRLLPLAPGKLFTFKVSNSERVYDLYVSISSRSRLHGQDVLHLVPFARINGDEFREGRASGYVTDDDKRIPIEFVIKAPVFTSVTARLVEQ